MGRKPKTTGPTAKDTDAFKSVLVRTTLKALAVEAFNDLLKKHGKRQSVRNPLLD